MCTRPLAVAAASTFRVGCMAMREGMAVMISGLLSTASCEVRAEGQRKGESVSECQ